MRETEFFTDGNRKIKLFSMRNSSGFGVDISDLGATIVNLFAPDRRGKLLDLALGFQDPAHYLTNVHCFGTVIGRVAGRIKNASTPIAGKGYHLPANENGNTLHSGLTWLDAVYEASDEGANTLRLRRTDPSGEGNFGFPGNLEVEILYQVTDENELIIDYAAKTDAPTLVNLTNHVYFNLNGAASGTTVADHTFAVNSSERLELDGQLLPTGRRLNVERTPYDLRTPVKFADTLKKLDGFDCYFILETMQPGYVDAVAYSETSGIEMRVYTTELGIQFYTANGCDGSAIGKGGIPCRKFCGFAMEAMGYPDACSHRSTFPPISLAPGETYRQRTIYKFLTRKATK